MKKIGFEWNKAVYWPSIIYLDARPFPLLLLSLVVDSAFTIWLFVFPLFLIASITGKNLPTMLRKIKSKLVGKTLYGYPLNKQHGMRY